MTDLKHLKLMDILPSSISSDSQVQAASAAIDPELISVSHDIREALISSRIDELSEPVLDLLAWQWHVDFYEPEALPVHVKRNLIRSSIQWHRKKGTPWAVKQIIRDITGLEPVINEWFNSSTRTPHTFGIEIYVDADPSSTDILGEGTKELLIRAVEAVKPVRSWLSYAVLIPDTPDIPENHACHWDFCHFDHGKYGEPDRLGSGHVIRTAPAWPPVMRITVTAHSRYMSGLVWDWSCFDSAPPISGPSDTSARVRLCGRTYRAAHSDTTWGDYSWLDGGTWEYPSDLPHGDVTARSYSQLVLSGPRGLDDINAVMGGSYTEISPSFRLDGTTMDSFIPEPAIKPIERYEIVHRDGRTTSPDSSSNGKAVRISMSGSTFRITGMKGRTWDENVWEYELLSWVNLDETRDTQKKGTIREVER